MYKPDITVVISYNYLSIDLKHMVIKVR